MMHLYSTLLCIAVHPKRFTIMCVCLCVCVCRRGGGGGGSLITITSVQHPLGWCDGCHRTTAPVRSPHTSYRWRGERVIEPIKWMEGIWPGHRGYTPTLYGKCHGIFNDHRESGPRFNISSERHIKIYRPTTDIDMLFYVKSLLYCYKDLIDLHNKPSKFHLTFVHKNINIYTKFYIWPFFVIWVWAPYSLISYYMSHKSLIL